METVKVIVIVLPRHIHCCVEINDVNLLYVSKHKQLEESSKHIQVCSGALRTVQIKITRNFVIMIFIHKCHRIGMFITCVGGKHLQLLVGVELRSHDTVLSFLKLTVAS